MHKLTACLVIVFFSLLTYGCNTGSDYQQNMEKLDKIHGKCDNPYRTYSKIEYEVCKDKERAAGPDGKIDEAIDIRDMIAGIGRGGQTVMLGNDTNNYLWDASLKMLSPFSLKISEFDGGYIETNWINDGANPNNRCIIKVHITSPELVSNGVTTKIICEKKENDEWFQSNENFQKEEKDLTIKILTEASKLSTLSNSSK